jgi:4-diphosphocytidyl-2-C-methyl-D-erythritol kinase
MDKIFLKSIAKINIGLNIVSKRSDGFHDLETIFYPINLYDEIIIEKDDHFSFSCNDSALNSDGSNLILKSHKAVENYFNKNFDVKITLIKNIPIGAGLGGGSSNAATTILGLLKLFNLSVPNTDLLKTALSLGSDVPFFLNPEPSFAESSGEILTPLNISINKFLLLVNPGIHISTRWAFGLVEPRQPKLSLSTLINKASISVSDLKSIAINDFENVVFREYKEIEQIKDNMIKFGSVFSMMTGTGSTVWGLFDEEEEANQAELFFKCKNYFTFLQSPI